jgi:putative DNA primase/helicase
MPLIATSREASGPTGKMPTGPKCASQSEIAEAMQVLHGGSGGSIGFTAVGVVTNGETSNVNLTFLADEMGFQSLAAKARELSPVAQAVYCTLNPISSVRGAPTNADVRSRRWLLIDADPIRPAGSSATEAEKQAAKVTVINTRRWLTETHGWARPILADSGNGYHLLFPIDLPNDAESTDLVKRVLATVAERWDDAAVSIDRKVYDARRVVKLYGTLSRKGEHTPDRPHRCSALLAVPERQGVVSLDQIKALVSTAEPTPATNGKPSLTVYTPPSTGLKARAIDPEETYTRNALAGELAKLAGTGAGNRNNQLFASAANLYEFVNAGKLDAAEVADRVTAVAKGLGLSDIEIATALGSARRKTAGKARDLSHLGKSSFRTTAPVVLDPEGGTLEKLDDPHRLAREFIRAHYLCDQGPTLRYWDEEWWTWSDAHWNVIADKELQCEITAFCKAEFDAAADGKAAKAVTSRTISNVLLALGSLLVLTHRNVPEQPAWIDIDGPPPRQCIACRNGVIHLPTLMTAGPEADGAHCLPTPKFFSPNVLGYSFDANAPRPGAWLSFLDSVWPDDEESKIALQQWFGYLLTADTAQQKILLLIGPKRSGKGTITRTLRALVGEENVAAPTLSALANPFGLQQLLGKTVAVVPESRLSGRADSQAIVERLLSISGEDPQSVERKHLTPWHGTLRTRFVLLGNELPRLGDYSGALPGRMIVLRMTRSFFDQEDLTLGERILAELPSILKWSLTGWRNLQDARRFLQPASGREILEDFETLSNPYGAFISERCELGVNHRVPCQDLYQEWKSWCETQGREHTGDIQGFGRSLRAAEATIEQTRPRVDGNLVRMYRGIRIKSKGDADSF